MEQQIEQRVFYSSAAALQFAINKPRRVISDGQATTVGPDLAVFTPIGNEPFGRLVTRDPEVISACEKRMTEVGDIFDAKEYDKRTTPAEVRVAQMEREYRRILEEKNQLQEMLDSQGRGPRPK